jgi:hypothetical protein
MNDSKTSCYLLDELCSRLGFCFGKEVRERLINHMPGNEDEVDAFATRVLLEEGIKPGNKSLRTQIREVTLRYLVDNDGGVSL